MGFLNYLNPFNVIKDFVNIIDENDGRPHTFDDPYGDGNRRSQVYQSRQASPQQNYQAPQYQQYQWQPPPPLSVEEQWVGCWFHGTPTRDNAEDIYTYQRWKSKMNPPSIYMSNHFDTAKGYANGSGAVIVIHASPWVKIIHHNSDYFSVDAPPGWTSGQIPGLNPVAVLNTDGHQIM
jgi:hypothetical protein